MKTDQLINMLACGAEAVDPHPVLRRYAVALIFGATGAALLMLSLFGVRPDLADAARLPMFWIKLAFPALVLGGALAVAARLARPGLRLGGTPLILVVPVAALWVMGAFVLLHASPDERLPLVLGDSWVWCPFNIALLSVPAFGASLWAMRGLAPTRPALAGGAAGLVAGAAAALVYALHCNEMAAPFLGIWYVLGVLIPGAAGAMLGPRLLRW